MKNFKITQEQIDDINKFESFDEISKKENKIIEYFSNEENWINEDRKNKLNWILNDIPIPENSLKKEVDKILETIDKLLKKINNGNKS